jgi:class 3 adenylate cyclase
MSETRKLAAILVADVVGYSRLAGADEDRTLARLRGLRSDLIDPAIAAHRGRIVKRTGDGSIIEFRSVVDAVRCAIEVQQGLIERNAGVAGDRRIEFRVGIHVGDVVEESDGDLMGDSVNIAARLEGIAKPGAICLSEDAYRQVKGRLDLKVSDLGPTQLKNIAEPVHVYCLDRNRRSLHTYTTNLLYSAVYLAAIFVLTPSSYYLIALVRDTIGMHGLINMQILDNSTTANQVVVFALYLLLIDFFQYWWHRAQHRFPVLWDQHVVHHSDEAMNVTTAVRHHWSEFLFQGIVVSLPFTMLFKITPPQAGFVALIFGAWQFFVHANLRLHLGFFAWLAAGPQVHRIHHSIEAEHRDKNFAAYFPIWDVLFGTYHHPRRGEYPETGVDGFRLETPLALALHPFAAWARRIRYTLRLAPYRTEPRL